MDTKYDFKITTEYEVIGQGALITSPCQIGEWWVMPYEQYQGKIPPEIKQKLSEFLNSGVEIQGLLIADDMRDVEARRKKAEEEKKQKREARNKANMDALGTSLNIVGTVLFGVGMFFVYFLSAFTSYDPMIIAVLPSGEWICIASWYD
jgi:hypothetical protein